jgi:hypothetical protein
MKRIIVIFLLAALLLLGCAPEETVHTVTVNRNGIDYAFTVDTEHCTISDGQYTYTYTVNGDHTTITYPNGARYWESVSTTGAVISWDDNYDPARYVDGAILARHLTEAYEGPDDKIQMNGAILLGCPFLVIVGVFLAWDPVTALEFRYRWWFKNVEPSDWAILSTRISGVILAVMGAVLFFMAVIL